MNQNRYMFAKHKTGWLCLGIKLVSVEELTLDLLFQLKRLLFQVIVTEYIQTSLCIGFEKISIQADETYLPAVKSFWPDLT